MDECTPYCMCIYALSAYTSIKAKFLSSLICTARMGRPGADVSLDSTILSLKNDNISSYDKGEMTEVNIRYTQYTVQRMLYVHYRKYV